MYLDAFHQAIYGFSALLIVSCQGDICRQCSRSGTVMTDQQQCYFVATLDAETRFTYDQADERCRGALGCEGLATFTEALVEADVNSIIPMRPFKDRYRWVGVLPKRNGNLVSGWQWQGGGGSADWFAKDAEPEPVSAMPSQKDPLCVALSADGNRFISPCRLSLGYVCKRDLSKLEAITPHGRRWNTSRTHSTKSLDAMTTHQVMQTDVPPKAQDNSRWMVVAVTATASIVCTLAIIALVLLAIYCRHLRSSKKSSSAVHEPRTPAAPDTGPAPLPPFSERAHMLAKPFNRGLDDYEDIDAFAMRSPPEPAVAFSRRKDSKASVLSAESSADPDRPTPSSRKTSSAALGSIKPSLAHKPATAGTKDLYAEVDLSKKRNRLASTDADDPYSVTIVDNTVYG